MRIISRAMDVVWIILGALCLLAGIVGCVLPVLPGVPLAYAGMLLLQLTDKVQFTWQFLVIWGVVVVVEMGRMGQHYRNDCGAIPRAVGYCVGTICRGGVV